jgi:hypothetical protein
VRKWKSSSTKRTNMEIHAERFPYLSLPAGVKQRLICHSVLQDMARQSKYSDWLTQVQVLTYFPEHWGTNWASTGIKLARLGKLAVLLRVFLPDSSKLVA